MRQILGDIRACFPFPLCPRVTFIAPCIILRMNIKYTPWQSKYLYSCIGNMKKKKQNILISYFICIFLLVTNFVRSKSRKKLFRSLCVQYLKFNLLCSASEIERRSFERILFFNRPNIYIYILV